MILKWWHIKYTSDMHGDEFSECFLLERCDQKYVDTSDLMS